MGAASKKLPMYTACRFATSGSSLCLTTDMVLAVLTSKREESTNVLSTAADVSARTSAERGPAWYQGP